MNIYIRQFSGGEEWTSSFNLHFIINDMTNGTATFHYGDNVCENTLMTYEGYPNLIEPFKFQGVIDD